MVKPSEVLRLLEDRNSKELCNISLICGRFLACHSILPVFGEKRLLFHDMVLRNEKIASHNNRSNFYRAYSLAM